MPAVAETPWRTASSVPSPFDRAVEKHVTGIFAKLELTDSSVDTGRVLAVLRFPDGRARADGSALIFAC